ncbi:MAG: SusD/RagB family nutrient-binding outer membrane lipoprotein [Rikenellaceae bacterium]
MKKIVLSLILATGLCVSCSDYLDVNTDPNNPTDVSVDLIMPAAQTHLATTMAVYLQAYTGFFAQYFDQGLGANAYNELCDYSFGTDQFDDIYEDTYAATLEDLHQIQIKCEEDADWGNYFAATVLRCYAFQVIADLFGSAPYSEALLGSANATPAWDGGSDIYAGLLAELDAAEALLEGSETVTAGYILTGDVSEWVKVANTLRLKLLMRGSFAQDNSTAIKALISEGNFITSDVEFDAFEATDNKRNPWYETYDNSTSMVAAYPIASIYIYHKDTRIPALFEYNDNGNIFGLIPGSKNDTARNQTEYNEDQSLQSYIYLIDNPYIDMEVRPISLLTTMELNFFLAEAYLRFYSDDASAEAAYHAAVDASFDMYNTLGGSTAAESLVYGAGKYGEWPSAGSEEDKLEVIGLQKWIGLAMVNNMESWCELRRMGYPSLSSVSGTLMLNSTEEEYPTYTAGDQITPTCSIFLPTNSSLLQSVYFPTASSTLNPNTPSNGTGTTQLMNEIWWDVREN